MTVINLIGMLVKSWNAFILLAIETVTIYCEHIVVKFPAAMNLDAMFYVEKVFSSEGRWRKKRATAIDELGDYGMDSLGWGV